MRAEWRFEGMLCEAGDTENGVMWECPLLMTLDFTPDPSTLEEPEPRAASPSLLPTMAERNSEERRAAESSDDSRDASPGPPPQQVPSADPAERDAAKQAPLTDIAQDLDPESAAQARQSLDRQQAARPQPQQPEQRQLQPWHQLQPEPPGPAAQAARAMQRLSVTGGPGSPRRLSSALRRVSFSEDPARRSARPAALHAMARWTGSMVPVLHASLAESWAQAWERRLQPGQPGWLLCADRHACARRVSFSDDGGLPSGVPRGSRPAPLESSPLKRSSLDAEVFCQPDSPSGPSVPVHRRSRRGPASARVPPPCASCRLAPCLWGSSDHGKGRPRHFWPAQQSTNEDLPMVSGWHCAGPSRQRMRSAMRGGGPPSLRAAAATWT